VYSVNSYLSVLAAFRKAGYVFRPLGDSLSDSDHKIALLRHDIDYDLESALAIAEANATLGIRACFCLQLRNTLYNLLEESNLFIVRKIVELGHDIGLHFRFPEQMSTVRSAESAPFIKKQMLRDLRLLGEVLELEVKRVVSWHNPSLLSKDQLQVVSMKSEGIVNPYHLVSEGLAYASDSNHRYSIEQWMNIAEGSPDRIHLLFHPFQWVTGARSMEQTLFATLKRHFRLAESEFLTNHVYKKRIPNGTSNDAFGFWKDSLGG